MKIILTRQAVAESQTVVGAYTLQVTATYEDLTPAPIFVFHAAELDDPIRGDKFSRVASLFDMDTLPIDNPTEVPGNSLQNFIPYYRTNTVTLDCVNTEELERAWSIIKYDTKDLVNATKASVNLENKEVVIYE